jgi:hypothetical protein
VANGLVADPSTHHYGAVGFISATANVFIGNLAAWISFPYFLLYLLFVPLILIDVVLAVVLAARPGKSGQVGRGMLIGLLSVPLSPALNWTWYLATLAIGPI